MRLVVKKKKKLIYGPETRNLVQLCALLLFVMVEIINIFLSGELEKESVTEKISATAADGKNYPTQYRGFNRAGKHFYNG